MAFNKDEMHPPSWMDRAFFEKVLRHSERDSTLAVTGCRIVPGTKPGDHFASIIFRAIVTHNKSPAEVSLIVKTLPFEDGLKKDLLDDGYVFETETLMYTEIVPAMHKLLRSVGDQTVLGARLLYHEKLPSWVMVFEDIAKHGFEMKSKQLDYEESKVVFAKLARWHATSMMLADEIPAIKKLAKGVFNLFEEKTEFLKMWQANIEILASIVPEIPGCEQYGDRILAVKEKIFKRAATIYTYDASSLVHVLNHGDFHFKNMMFKRTEGKLDDIMLLDFQLSVWGTPAVDLIYAMYNAVSIDTKEAHREELIYFYHQELVECLRKIGYLRRLPTLLDIQVEIMKCGHMEFLLSSTFVPFMCVEMTEIMDLPEDGSGFEMDFANTDKLAESFKKCFRTPVYVDFITKNLPKFVYKGFVDLD
ncbi:uncharacterized protein LOC131212951 [Anopheles bellator]|uniref:uncharacterized protein LOC131212951 n=1 Tax=Anopheles bellator TaxID=139047 RepID=UPI0026495D4E|nr:uncharacterized protein LOC131212951 [Anopheles bellator]